MIIVDSSRYVDSDIELDLGKIPVAFVPVGNKKLLQYHRNRWAREEMILVLPSDYALTVLEHEFLVENSIQFIKVNSSCSLLEKMRLAVDVTAEPNSITFIDGGVVLTKDLPMGYYCDDFGHNFLFCDVDVFNVQCLRSASTLDCFLQRMKLTKNALCHTNCMYCDTREGIFDARSRMTTQRVFNDLSIVNGIVHKTSCDGVKIKAESNWYRSLPNELKSYSPRFIATGLAGNGLPWYEIEYVEWFPLNEMFVHGHIDRNGWAEVTNFITHYLKLSRECFIGKSVEIEDIKEEARDLYKLKTLDRLSTFAKNNQINIGTRVMYDGVELPSIESIAHECINLSLALPIVPAILHGDLCFSNILCNRKKKNIQVIDPRGINCSREQTIYGDQKYDIAKFLHSVIGMYDFIISGHYFLSNTSQRGFKLSFPVSEEIRCYQNEILQQTYIEELQNIKLIPTVVLLFLSMPPLHSDNLNRQHALLVNAIRLYKEKVFNYE